MERSGDFTDRQLCGNYTKIKRIRFPLQFFPVSWYDEASSGLSGKLSAQREESI